MEFATTFLTQFLILSKRMFTQTKRNRVSTIKSVPSVYFSIYYPVCRSDCLSFRSSYIGPTPGLRTAIKNIQLCTSHFFFEPKYNSNAFLSDKSMDTTNTSFGICNLSGQHIFLGRQRRQHADHQLQVLPELFGLLHVYLHHDTCVIV